MNYQPGFIEIAIVLTEIAILNTDNKGRTNLKKKNFLKKNFFFSTRSTTQHIDRNTDKGRKKKQIFFLD